MRKIVTSDESDNLEEVTSPIASSSKQDPHVQPAARPSLRTTRSSCVAQKELEKSVSDAQKSPVQEPRVSKKVRTPTGPSSKVSCFKDPIFRFLYDLLILAILIVGASVIFPRGVDRGDAGRGSCSSYSISAFATLENSAAAGFVHRRAYSSLLEVGRL